MSDAALGSDVPFLAGIVEWLPLLDQGSSRGSAILGIEDFSSVEVSLPVFGTSGREALADAIPNRDDIGLDRIICCIRRVARGHDAFEERADGAIAVVRMFMLFSYDLHEKHILE